MREAARVQVTQQLRPTVGGFPVAVLERDELLGPVGPQIVPACRPGSSPCRPRGLVVPDNQPEAPPWRASSCLSTDSVTSTARARHQHPPSSLPG